MVKGNKERRQELARRRNDEKTAETSRRKLGPAFATPAEARARLLSDARASPTLEAALLGWVVAPGGREGCEPWFRTGACPHKRCRFAHEASISHLAGVPAAAGASALSVSAATARGRSASPSARRGGAARRAPSAEGGAAPPGGVESGGGGGGGGGGGSGGGSGSGSSGVGSGVGVAPPPLPAPAAFPVLEAKPLRECDGGAKMVFDRTIRTAVRTESSLYFISKGGTLVFDVANAFVFAAYCEAAVASASASSSGGGGGGPEGEPESPLDAALRVRFAAAGAGGGGGEP